jgi:hypothetical protein
VHAWCRWHRLRGLLGQRPIAVYLGNDAAANSTLGCSTDISAHGDQRSTRRDPLVRALETSIVGNSAVIAESSDIEPDVSTFDVGGGRRASSSSRSRQGGLAS